MKNKTTISHQIIIDKSNESFKKLQGVTKIELYGSIKNKKADKYSDIDLEVFSSNQATVLQGLSKTIAEIGQTLVVIPISITKTDRVYTIVWKNYPFYQKMDLRLIFKSTSINTKKNESINYNEKYRFFHDYFIGAIRYTKYRKRKMEWTAYRFYKASIEMWLKLITNDLTLDSFINLDKSGTSSPKRLLYIKDSREMDKKMINLSSMFLQLSLNKHKITKASNEAHFGLKVLEFMNAELKPRT